MWGGGINRDRKAVLIYVGSRVRNFRGRHGHWRLLYYPRVELVTAAAVWLGIGAAFGNAFMVAILSYGVPRIKKNWETVYKLNTRVAASS